MTVCVSSGVQHGEFVRAQQIPDLPGSEAALKLAAREHHHTVRSVPAGRPGVGAAADYANDEV